MKLATGNMFSHPADLILVTTNSYVRTDGGLVMGRGAAAQLKIIYPRIEYVLGEQLLHRSRYTPRYGLLFAPLLNNIRYGAFQVKYHWGKPAVPDLISYSVSKLIEIAPQYHSISLNYPGIGNGGLSKEAVRPLIEPLPNNVTVWEML